LVELERHLLLGRLGLGLLGQLRVLLLAPEFLAGLAEELAPALGRAQLLGQLVAALLAVELVLGLVGRLRLGEDLARDLGELTVCLRARVAGEPGAVDRPTPGLASPALAQSPSTSPNSSASARSWRQTKRAIVA
jgi:hypothetical protein